MGGVIDNCLSCQKTPNQSSKFQCRDSQKMSLYDGDIYDELDVFIPPSCNELYAHLVPMSEHFEKGIAGYRSYFVLIFKKLPEDPCKPPCEKMRETVCRLQESTCRTRRSSVKSACKFKEKSLNASRM